MDKMNTPACTPTLQITLYAIEHDWPSVVLSDINRFYDALSWCKKNCVGKFSYAGSRFYFIDSEEATIFALHWV